jgi:hypothetical protein
MKLQQHLQQPPPPVSGMTRWFSGEAEKVLKERLRRSRRGRDCLVCVERIIKAVVSGFFSFIKEKQGLMGHSARCSFLLV